MNIEQRIESLNQRIAMSCLKTGRDIQEVKIVAVSKKMGPVFVQQAVACGLQIFGENRIQEAKEKIPQCSNSLHWHLLGHLQRNKVKPAVSLFEVIHSVDSEELLLILNQTAKKIGKNIRVFLQVNVSGEARKYGMNPDQLIPMLETGTALMNVEIMGLMTMPPLTEKKEDCRKYFVILRDLRDKARKHTGFPLEDLSMGMSRDFEVAIEEGATYIRIGTEIFGLRS